MLINHSIIAVAASTIFFTLIAFNIFILFSQQTKHYITRLTYAVAIAIITLYMPVYQGYSVVVLLRGVLNDLSITSLIVFAGMLYHAIFIPAKTSKINQCFATLIIILGTLLYLSTFGFIAFDIYALGYLPNHYVLLGFVVLEFFLFYFASSYAWLWLLALGAYVLKLEASINLWDYLLDPVLWLLCIISLFKRE